MKLLKHWLLLQGRLSCGQFWLHALLLWLLFYGVWEGLGLALVPQGVALWWVNLPMLWLLFVLCVRRLHDRNYSGFWMLMALIPVFGALWLLWQLALRRGLDQPNRWGEDPQQAAGDFLQVR
jgi:uncharacterized membrane protein YhaH (DUF805 family)